MHTSRACVLLSAVALASAFQDASPFMYFSTSSLSFSSPRISTSSQISASIQAELQKCPSNIYVLANQPGVSSEDFAGDGATPYLKQWMLRKDESIKSSFPVPEVVGDVELGELEKTLERDCGAETLRVDASTGLLDIVRDEKPRVVRVQFPALPLGEKRRVALRENDLFLSNLVDMIPTSDYTVIYTTSPAAPGSAHVEESTSYQMEHHMDPMAHMELKRDLGVHARAANDSIVLPEGPLFERYQFFTPAIFMGLVTMVFLISIMFVAVRAIAGLEVTYGAFEKDMSQQQQKKAQ